MARPRLPLAARSPREVLAAAHAAPLRRRRASASDVIDATAEVEDVAPSAAPAGALGLPAGDAPARPAGSIQTDLSAARGAADSAAAYATAAAASANRAARVARGHAGRADIEQMFDRANAQATAARAAATRARSEADGALIAANGGDADGTRAHMDNAAYQVGEARHAAQLAEQAAAGAEALAPSAAVVPFDATTPPVASRVGSTGYGSATAIGPDAAPMWMDRLATRMGLDAGDPATRAVLADLTPAERDNLAAGDGEPGDTPERVALAFARLVYGDPATHGAGPALAWLESNCVSAGPLRVGRLGNVDAAWCALPERLAWRASDAGRAWKLEALYAAVPGARPAPGAPNPAAALTTDEIEYILLSPEGRRADVYATKIASACRPPVPASGELTQAEIDAWNAAHPDCAPATPAPASSAPSASDVPATSDTPAPSGTPVDGHAIETQAPAPAPRMSWWQIALLGLGLGAAGKVGYDHLKKRGAKGGE